MRRMRIAILGSSRTANEVGDGIVEPGALEQFCQHLGSTLADLPHTLLVQTDRPRSADRLVVDGVLASAGSPRARIWVYHRSRRGSRAPFADEAARAKVAFQF